MSSLSRELVFLILQFLDEEKFKETVHKLEQESGFFFNMKYFEDQVQAGEWDEVERYLCGFTKVEDNRYSMKIFFELRKQKYLEALDQHDRAKAAEILVKDLKVFASFNELLFKEITQLLTLDNFRQNEQLSKYGDTKSARNIMLVELKKLIEANPLFRDKLTFPTFNSSRLRTLINQSLNWQHQLCKNPRPNPDIKTLFTDHTCASSNGARAPPPTNNPLAGPVPRAGVFPPIGAHIPFQPVVSPAASAIAGWMSNANPSMPHAAVAPGPPGLVQPPGAAAFLKHPRTPPGAPGMDYQTADSEHLMKRIRSGQSDEVSFSGSTFPNIYSPDDLPKTVVRNLNQGSSVMSMDFHPQQQTFLLVGTNVGDISIWEVGSRERLAHKPFKVWDLSACTMPLQTALVKDATISVNRCIWGPDGSILGVAFSKHIVQIYTYNPAGELRQHLEIDAHVGGVNDIAFAHPNKQLCIVTCGDDKTIKVWDAVAGRRQYIFEGHEAAVYSVCPHYKENIQFIFSTAIDGKIKAWLYDCLGSRVDYDAPGLWCTAMAYSADGTRLFSCGTSKEGESHLVEWNESEGAIKRTYSGFRKRSSGVVQFDTTKNRFLAAGDEFQIKFWDMDSTNILTITDADGGLPASPRLKFNKEGSLMAVTTSDSGIKILANIDGQRMLRMLESRAFEGSRSLSEAVNVKPPIAGALGPITNLSGSAVPTPERSDRIQPPVSIGTLAAVESSRAADIKPRILDNVGKVKSWKIPDIVDSAQLKALRLPDPLTVSKVVRLLYTNSGLALLALASNAVHKLWKWQRTDRNPSGKSTASIVPQLWQPSTGALMTNDSSDTKPAEESAACIALSKNDSYVMSASGGKVSLFNMMTFKVMTTFMAPPPAATYLAFHPQDNNIIAIGMEDSTIQIYNVRVDEVKTKLNGHQKRITGLAFSKNLNVLVSSGADAQLCVWNIDGWEKRKAMPIQVPTGHQSPLVGETKVQFNKDQTHLLVVHESQIAIYDSQLELLRSWYPRDSLSAAISSAIYSCDGLLIFTGFCDGAIGVFDADSLRLRCRIAPSAYISSSIASSNGSSFPVVIAAHPSEPNQIALGMSDGAVHVIEPSDAEPKWGSSVPQENGALPSVASNSALNNSQPSETPSR
ncbi:protein TOPLESS-RELATED PROTEIN 2-like isoform X2 [Camellia sinensis]|uniref:protein TOPLESS-RELATED PROTEIN 2-like isoform X1 n=1 Tax=Camellia sinensis TaxID=4442 RepID=UPI0010357574|nr:protein TOPLESS-RELATED PROTEIN 2-like isoform X1 [Camellia sinensis]XP_028105464.1 protein TOPLESS-RELATED PROTEIN 2-like isoform X1 [Camellia sinensis]XP_028105465.1 protein TOPLESS-RELATED PROTEIN 2-like isoform X1 [Camellia sinensis]XP_028105467.1 protein TOPLESS-RELATED PROTEIN 2-like isoform X1 [Camellia sinensis]XP_028105468.1 protein TOPLESS-RELATED PROTEIN 2-like isoform X2 [Camellia sinensis]